MRRLFPTLVLLIILGGAAFWFLTEPTPVVSPAVAAALETGGDAERGKVIFNAGGCSSCHVSQGQPEGQVDRLKLGGGLELKSPFGSFFAPNISPDPSDGIGKWKVADLVNAMQGGVSPSGQHYYPAFPYTTYAHAKVGDIRDLMTYLRTLAPVQGKAPAHTLSFPFDIRRGMGVWKRLYLDQTPVIDDASRPANWNRGQYLVMALGHCVECHSGRDVFGGIQDRYVFAGGPDLEGKEWVPNITQHKDGIADWSEKDISYMLRTGETPDNDSVGSSMVAVVRNMAELPDGEREAIASYIKSLPPREGPPKPPKKEEPKQ
jgi:mono/diheme cytochrome c family protein